jgi:iron complex transport system ATP-binding protein
MAHSVEVAGSDRVSALRPLPSALDLRGVRFGWPGRPVLRDVSLRVAPGEFVGLLGPNGSGKSTLLRLIAGTLRPAAGEVRVAGLVPGRGTRAALARQVALVAQSSVLPELFTVAELTLLGRTPHLRAFQAEGEADYAAARRALVAAECLELAGRRLGELSGGERQRVSLARALAQEPAILLLDEPTAHLDPGVGQEIMATLLRLNQEDGLTVLATWHDMNLAAATCPRLLLLHEGRLIADGLPGEVLTPHLLRLAYGYEAQVIAHPQTGRPVVLPSYGPIAP